MVIFRTSNLISDVRTVGKLYDGVKCKAPETEADDDMVEFVPVGIGHKTRVQYGLQALFVTVDHGKAAAGQEDYSAAAASRANSRRQSSDRLSIGVKSRCAIHSARL